LANPTAIGLPRLREFLADAYPLAVEALQLANLQILRVVRFPIDELRDRRASSGFVFAVRIPVLALKEHSPSRRSLYRCGRYNGRGILDTLRRLARLRVGERRLHRSFLIWRPRRRLTILLKNFGLWRRVRDRLSCVWCLDFRLLDLDEALAVARLSLNRQSVRPCRGSSHDLVEFFRGANADRQLAHNLIVHM